MSEKLKGIFGKLIDITHGSSCDINISFVSHQEPRLNIIRKENKSSDVTDEDNKELTSLLSDIKSHFKKAGVPLNITQNDTEKSKTVTSGQNPGKAALSDAEIALQKMQCLAQELGAELVLTDRPAEMANERWRLPEESHQESRAVDMPAAEGLAKLAVAVQAVTDQCPLQITLMIQPDSRPQVMLNVSAGEVNWIFAAKEGRYPLDDLLAKMAGKTTTHGWDAIVVYQRGQANMLLKQQHIKRFITGNVLAPLNEDIESSDATRLQTHNLTLSAPHLSFDGAGTGDSMAQVGWDFVKGMIVFKQEADDGSYRVKKIEKITPLNSPCISMKVPLSRAPGSVNDVGEVQFDIKEGHSLTNNLVVNDVAQDVISGFFKRWFEATPPDQRIYKLGTISHYEDEKFLPEEFVIRTVKAPNAASRGSQDEGDGAVVLFVRVKDSDTKPDGTEVDWLLADNYSSALVISNYQLLDKIIRRGWNGFHLVFDRYEADAGKPGKVEAFRGQIQRDFAFNESAESRPDKRYAWSVVSLNITYARNKFGSTTIPLTLSTLYNDKGIGGICLEYKVDGYFSDENIASLYRTLGYHYYTSKRDEAIFADVHFRGDYFLSIHFKSMYTAVINDDVVSFVYNPDESFSKIEVSGHKASDSNDVNDLLHQPEAIEYMSKYMPDIKNIIFESVSSYLNTAKFNNINTFTLRNLLFPADNYFRVQDACAPCDLLVMGRLGVGAESFAVTPTETSIVAGSEYQFRTTPEVSGVKWSISDSEKGNTNADLGHIDSATGKYTAPQAKAITEGVRHVVVCAEKGDTKVYALASVLAHSVNISPAYQVILPGKSSALTAESLNGGELTWTLADNPQGSALTKVSNNEYTYTAGKKNKKLKLNLERVSVTDKTGTTTEAMILVRNVPLTGYLRVSYDNVPENSVQLTYFPDPDDTETAIPADDIEWTVLESGGATLDTETGILSCSQPTDNSFAVISTKYLDEDEGALYCAIAIPLPLNTYKETILAAYSPEQS